MAKDKSTEVIHTGEPVDPMAAALRMGKTEERATKRIRQQPDVIDATQRQAKTSIRDSDLGSLERDLDLTQTAEAHPQQAVPDPAPQPASAPVAPAPAAPTPVAAPPAPAPQAPAPAPAAAAPKPAPEPAPKKKKKSKPSTSKQLTEEAAASTVTSLVDQMKAKSESNGGYLRTSDIVAMEKDLQAQVATLSASMALSFEAFVEAKEKAEWDPERKSPFGRIVVKKFSHLFNEPKKGRMDTISKRMLPGFFMGLDMMIGPENVDLFQERCSRIIETIREEEGDDFDWDSVYESPEANAVVLDGLMAIAPHFEKFERRQEWLIELINSHLSFVSDDSSEDAGWEMTPAGYKRMLAAMYAELAKHLANGAAAAAITKRYGGNAVDAVKIVIELTKPKAA